MQKRSEGGFALGLMACVLFVGCAERSVSSDGLGEAIRSAGFSCTDVASFVLLGDGDAAWRVSCGDGAVYTARLQNGNVCIAPAAYIDAVVAVGESSSDESCVTIGDM
jgi:hypothetical protein